MSDSEKPTGTAKESKDEDVRVADPEEYNQTQRLREIHKARREVSKQVRDMDIDEQDGTVPKLYSVTELAHTVALYVRELEPLMKKSNVDSEIFELPDGMAHDTIFDYANTMGMELGDDYEPVSPNGSILVYSRCNQFMSEVGLGVDLDAGLPDDELEL